MLILVDMDNVITDLSGQARKTFTELHPEVELVEQASHFFGADYSEHREAIVAMYLAPGFFLGLSPIPGSIEGLRRLVGSGHDVVLCTSHVATATIVFLKKANGCGVISLIFLAK